METHGTESTQPCCTGVEATQVHGLSGRGLSWCPVAWLCICQYKCPLKIFTILYSTFLSASETAHVVKKLCRFSCCVCLSIICCHRFLLRSVYSFSFPVLKVTRAVKASMPCTPIAVYLERSHEWRRQNFGDSKTYFKMFKGKKIRSVNIQKSIAKFKKELLPSKCIKGFIETQCRFQLSFQECFNLPVVE